MEDDPDEAEKSAFRCDLVKDQSLFLAIDNGTQSLRALIFDAKGNLLVKSRQVFQPYVSPQPGWAEQDPEVFWEALCTACRQLWAKEPRLKARLVGVALTTQRATVVCLDNLGRPLRPAIHWLDQRTAEIEKVGGLWGWLFRLAGVRETVTYLQRNAESNWLRRHQPEIWRKTRKFLLLSGFLHHRITGQYTDSTACQVGYLPFDYKKQRWAGARDWRWQALGIQPEMLCDLVPPGSILGEVTGEAAQQTGIPRGLPVVAAAADKACEILGTGVLSPDTASISLGTTASINTLHQKYVEAFPFIPPYPAPIAGAFSTEIQVFRGYWMVEWFKREFGHPEMIRAKNEDAPVESYFETLLQQTQPGAEGLILQPFWSPGLKFPGPEARGTVAGFTDRQGRAHLYRAIIEGLAFALRAGKERLERRAKTPITSAHASGGGSQSDGALRITADILGLPVKRFRTYEASGLGAAIIAAVALGSHPNHQAAAKAMTQEVQTFVPHPDHRDLYDRIYRRVYAKLYGKLRAIYQNLKSIKEISGP